MKKLGRGCQISVQSHQEIVSALERAALELSERGREYVGKKLTTGMVLNAILRDALDRPDRLEVVAAALDRLERWALGEPSVPAQCDPEPIKGPYFGRNEAGYIPQEGIDKPVPKRRRPKRGS